MIESRPHGLPPQAPDVAPPPRFTERRGAYRRAEDRAANEERVLLARMLDVLAEDGVAEERLAGLLRLLARTVGARRAAVVADGAERRAAVAVDQTEDPAEAEELAAWLDFHAPRSRPRRAASGRAPISFIVGGRVRRDQPESAPDVVRWPTKPAALETSRPCHFAMVPIAAAGDVALGFEFARAADAARVAERLPRSMARHAAVALALVTGQLADERLVAELDAREVERTTFVSTVAHELRTPLTGLAGYLELILDGKVDDPAVERDFLERSRAIVGSMGELVGDLLELSRLESGTLNLELGPFSIAEAGSQVAAGLLPIAISRDLALTTSLPPRLRVATGDRRRVEQVLTNLAANALKFTPAGGRVEIEGRVEGLVAFFVVRDDGKGIAAEDRGRIFERFHRLADHERVSGTGLGLPIARDLARQMGGDLDVASVRGSGSAFVLALPGPAEVDPGTISTALRQALEAEELALEERVVRRAIAALPVVDDDLDDDFGSPGGEDRGDDDDDLASGPGADRQDSTSRASGPGRLRALPSLKPGRSTLG